MSACADPFGRPPVDPERQLPGQCAEIVPTVIGTPAAQPSAQSRFGPA